MLSKILKMKHHHQTIFSVIIGIAVISFWRAIWGFMDEYIFPDNYRLSLWISLALGIAILVATHYATKELM
jgi:hypothetical protein